jgi:hypothetical protein
MSDLMEQFMHLLRQIEHSRDRPDLLVGCCERMSHFVTRNPSVIVWGAWNCYPEATIAFQSWRECQS